MNHAVRAAVAALALGFGSAGTAVAAPPADLDAIAASFEEWAGQDLVNVACQVTESLAVCYGMAPGEIVVASGTPIGPGQVAGWSEIPLPDAVASSVVTEAPGTGPLTPADLDAALTEPVTAWLASPTPDTEAAVRAATAGLLSAGRALGEDLLDAPAPWLTTAQNTLDWIAENPSGGGNDGLLVRLLTDLALSMPLPPTVRGGMFLVGDTYTDPDPNEPFEGYGSVVPGTYRATFVDDCFWETLDASGGTIDSAFVLAAPQVLVTITPDAYAFRNECGWLVLADWTPPTPTAP